MKIYIVNGKPCYSNFQPIPDQVYYMMIENGEIEETEESTMTNFYTELAKIDVSKHVEKKGKFSYFPGLGR